MGETEADLLANLPDVVRKMLGDPDQLENRIRRQAEVTLAQNDNSDVFENVTGNILYLSLVGLMDSGEITEAQARQAFNLVVDKFRELYPNQPVMDWGKFKDKHTQEYDDDL